MVSWTISWHSRLVVMVLSKSFFLGVPLIGFGAIVDQKDLNLKGGCTDILGSTDSNTKGHLCIKMAQQPCRLPWDKRQQQLRFSELILKKKGGKKPQTQTKQKQKNQFINIIYKIINRKHKTTVSQINLSCSKNEMRHRLWWATSVLTEHGSQGEILNVSFDSMTKAFSEILLNSTLMPA